jgi:putative transposase
MKAAKFRFYPTLKQRKHLSKEFGHSRYVYNWGLKTKSELYQNDKQTISRFGLSNQLTQEKKKISWLKEASATVLSEALEDLDNGFKAFFKKNAKYPKRKRRLYRASCRYTMDKRQKRAFVDGKVLKLPKLGACKIRWTSRVDTYPNSATVSKDCCGDFYVSLQFDSNQVVTPKLTSQKIGIDLGCKDSVVTSDGEKKRLSDFVKIANKLKYNQKSLSRSKKGSKNRNKKRLRVARSHRRIANKREDFLHKLSTSIVRENQVIAIEDLSVSSMVKTKNSRKILDPKKVVKVENSTKAGAVRDEGKREQHTFFKTRRGEKAKNRSILSQGFRKFRTYLEYKAKWYGRDLIVCPRFERTTGVCPICEEHTKLTLDQREWECPKCFQVHDRDISAARMILRTAERVGVSKRGEVCGEDVRLEPCLLLSG